jgi:peptidyl-prolyl cis-trans isomerase B (cyclophilin B)
MNPTVTLTIDNTKTIEVELFPEVAENSVNNFISLASNHFYDGLIFHRVIPGFMIQGGCPKKDGTGNPGYAIPGEFSGNGFKNELKHAKGVLSMARAQQPDSAGSQFFIMAANSPHLDGQYAAFGQVVSNLEVIDEIVNSKRDRKDKPLEDIVITSAVVDLKDYEPKPVVKK